jgi:hypothetical protein
MPKIIWADMYGIHRQKGDKYSTFDVKMSISLVVF